MKKIINILTIALIITLAGCQQAEKNNCQKNNTKSFQVQFPSFTEQQIKDNTYDALNFFNGKTCNVDISSLYKSYMASKNIENCDCSIRYIEQYKQLLDTTKNIEEVYNYLIAQNVITDEEYKII